MLSGSVALEREFCFNTTDRLYMIDGYANYVKNNVTFNQSVTKWQNCLLNQTAYYQYSLVNISNISNGTFVATWDYKKLGRVIDSKGAFS